MTRKLTRLLLIGAMFLLFGNVACSGNVSPPKEKKVYKIAKNHYDQVIAQAQGTHFVENLRQRSAYTPMVLCTIEQENWRLPGFISPITVHCKGKPYIYVNDVGKANAWKCYYPLLE